MTENNKMKNVQGIGNDLLLQYIYKVDFKRELQNLKFKYENFND